MDNQYQILGVREDASSVEIKRSFREKAKQLHPDIAGKDTSAQMQKLLAAYEILSDRQRRYEYDRLYHKKKGKGQFNYRDFLVEQVGNPECQAKLVVYDLLHFEEESAIKLWRVFGGVNFPLHKYLLRDEWMDCAFILAEELDKRRSYYETFVLLVNLVREDRKSAYFQHFSEDLETFLKELVRTKLRPSVNHKTWVECVSALLELGFSPHEEARWLKSQAEAFVSLGERSQAEIAFREAKKRDPSITPTVKLKNYINV